MLRDKVGALGLFRPKARDYRPAMKRMYPGTDRRGWQTMLEDRIFPATLMPDPGWWHTSGLTRIALSGFWVSTRHDDCRLGLRRRLLHRGAGPAGCPGAHRGARHRPGDAGKGQGGVPGGDQLRLAARRRDGVEAPGPRPFRFRPDGQHLSRSTGQDGARPRSRGLLRPQGRFAIVNWYPIPREQTRCWANRGVLRRRFACRRIKRVRQWSRPASNWRIWSISRRITTGPSSHAFLRLDARDRIAFTRPPAYRCHAHCSGGFLGCFLGPSG